MENYYPAILLAIAYFVPTILAIGSRSAAWGTCFFINLFFGWTFIGWIVALMLGNCPTKAQIAHRNRVRMAKDEFYLREAQKARSSRVQ
jgi:hypothetical protein